MDVNDAIPQWDSKTVDEMELKLLSHYPLVGKIKLSTAKSIVWKPWVPTKIGAARPLSAEEAVTNWFEEQDRWHTDQTDSSSWISLEEATTKEWCRHKTTEKLVSFLHAVNYPERHIKKNQITEQGYGVALEIQAIGRREQKTECMRAGRKRKRTGRA